MSSIGIPLNRVLYPINVNNRAFLPNQFNDCLSRESGLWNDINRKCGGLKMICPGTKYETPPWVKMPRQGRSIREINSIALPANNGNDTLVTSFLVPYGYDGVIVTTVNNYTGQGFVEGSGDLTWRLQLNERWVKDYGNVKTQIGSLTIPTNISNSILLQSGQLVRFFVNHSTTSLLAGGRIICACLGWYWPR